MDELISTVSSEGELHCSAGCDQSTLEQHFYVTHEKGGEPGAWMMLHHCRFCEVVVTVLGKPFSCSMGPLGATVAPGGSNVWPGSGLWSDSENTEGKSAEFDGGLHVHG